MQRHLQPYGAQSAQRLRTRTKKVERTPCTSGRGTPLFPVGPGITLLLVFLSCEGFDAKALRALFADSDFRWLAAHIANMACLFGPRLRVAGNRKYLHILPPVVKSSGGLEASRAVLFLFYAGRKLPQQSQNVQNVHG